MGSLSQVGVRGGQAKSVITRPTIGLNRPRERERGGEPCRSRGCSSMGERIDTNLDTESSGDRRQRGWNKRGEESQRSDRPTVWSDAGGANQALPLFSASPKPTRTSVRTRTSARGGYRAREGEPAAASSRPESTAVPSHPITTRPPS